MSQIEKSAPVRKMRQLRCLPNESQPERIASAVSALQ
jgi:hypothetical protein